MVRPDQELTYDAFGRIATIENGDGDVQTRIYDASGNLLVQSDPDDGAQLFLGDTIVTKAVGASAASGSREYSLGGFPVAERNSAVGVSGTTTTWICANGQGTQLLEVAASTGVAEKRYVDPYGSSRGSAVAWSSVRSFLGLPESDFADLTQLGARAYDSHLGRFVTVDPVLAPDAPQQNSGYSYGWNNPVTSSDPSGRTPHNTMVMTDGGGGGTGGGSNPPNAPGSDPPAPEPPFWAGAFHPECGSWATCTPKRQFSVNYPDDWSSCGSIFFNGMGNCIPVSDEDGAKEIFGMALDIGLGWLLSRGLTRASTEDLVAGGEAAAAESEAVNPGAFVVVGDGSLLLDGEGFSESEIWAAEQLANQGRQVVLREADSAGPRTSDLLVNGDAYDVYTPKTGNLNRIVSSIADKGPQVNGGGVVVDLRQSPLTAQDFDGILDRVQNVTKKIGDIIVLGG